MLNIKLNVIPSQAYTPNSCNSEFTSETYNLGCVLWRANGQVEFCIVWHSKRVDESKHDASRWKKIGNVWWYRAPTTLEISPAEFNNVKACRLLMNSLTLRLPID